MKYNVLNFHPLFFVDSDDYVRSVERGSVCIFFERDFCISVAFFVVIITDFFRSHIFLVFRDLHVGFEIDKVFYIILLRFLYTDNAGCMKSCSFFNNDCQIYLVAFDFRCKYFGIGKHTLFPQFFDCRSDFWSRNRNNLTDI